MEAVLTDDLKETIKQIGDKKGLSPQSVLIRAIVLYERVNMGAAKVEFVMPDGGQDEENVISSS